MKNILIALCWFTVSFASLAQEQLPSFTEEALVSAKSTTVSEKGEYKLLVYGAIGCSFSRYLVENLNVFDNCENLEIILLLDDPKEAILKEYASLINKYQIYSNSILKHSFAKKNDITPQTFLFKSGKELLHIKGVKKKMFVKINKKINCK